MYLKVAECVQWGGRSPGFVSSFQLVAGNCLQKPSSKPWLKVGSSLCSKPVCIVCPESASFGSGVPKYYTLPTYHKILRFPQCREGGWFPKLGICL